jgi:hypothetical protein
MCRATVSRAVRDPTESPASAASNSMARTIAGAMSASRSVGHALVRARAVDRCTARVDGGPGLLQLFAYSANVIGLALRSTSIPLALYAFQMSSSTRAAHASASTGAWSGRSGSKSNVLVLPLRLR